MSVFSRRIKPNFGTQAECREGGEGLASIARSSPLSSQYEPECKSNNIGHIMIWMLARQKARYGEDITSKVPRKALTKHIGNLIYDFGPYAVKRAIHLALWRSDFPFSNVYILKLLGELGHERLRPRRIEKASQCTVTARTLWDS